MCNTMQIVQSRPPYFVVGYGVHPIFLFGLGCMTPAKPNGYARVEKVGCFFLFYVTTRNRLYYIIALLFYE